MKKALSYLYREILLELNQELDSLYNSEYDDDEKYKEPIEVFRVKYNSLNLEDVNNFDEDKVIEFYEEVEYEKWEDYIRDIVSDFRESGEEIDNKVEQDRYYCYQDVAKKITGSEDLYLGWTYYFGGGKHAQPDQVEWMEDCYLLTCREVEETRIIKIYEKVEEEQRAI